MKHVRYQSRGNTVGLEDGVEDYWEVADDGHVVRSVHFQQDGSVLKYDVLHAADRFGVLPEGIIEDQILADASLGLTTTISLADFDALWALKAKNERAEPDRQRTTRGL